MNDKSNLKKLVIEIISIVLIFTLLGGVLIFEQRGYQTETYSDDGSLIDEDTWYSVRNVNAGAIANNANKTLLVYDSHDSESVAIKKNIEYVLTSINVSVSSQAVRVPEEDDLTDEEIVERETNLYNFQEYNDIIICISNLKYIGVRFSDFSEWVMNGGHVMFAAGLESNSAISLYSELLGIVATDDVPKSVLADSLRFTSSILAGVDGREFSDDVINCDVLDVTVLENCSLHITTADDGGTPLLWEQNYGNGMVIVCNADMFDAKSDRGIIAAAYCQFYPVYVYPVINSAVYCIDDCPAPAPAGYDDNVLKQFGYTVDDYILNVWMPAMQKLSETYEIKFSTFTIQSYEDDVNGPFENTDHIKSAKYYASLILEMNGEIGIHGYNHQPLVLDGYVFDEENSGYNAWPSVKKMMESISSVIKYTEGLADDLYVQAYIAPSNVISEEALHELQNQFEDLRVYAGVYIGTPDQFIQEFEVLDNGTVYCPRLTADMQMEDSEWWVQINELNYHYVESNFIHPDDILDEERSDGGDFTQMLSSYEEMIKWNQKYGLRTATISECAAAVQRYCNLNYTQETKNNELNIKVDGLIDEAYMMLRLNDKKPVSIEGGTYEKLNDNVYVLKIENENVKIKLVNK